MEYFEYNTESLNEAERVVLKLLITNPNLQEYILQKCDVSFFADTLNRKIFAAAKELFANEKLVDNVGIFYGCDCNKEVGQRIFEIVESIAYPFAVRKYCKWLFEGYIKRLATSTDDIDGIEKIKQLQELYTFDDTKIKNVGDEVDSFNEKYELRKNEIILTGWSDLDSKIGSFCGGDYIALGGSTGTGKTSIALNVAMNLCMQDKHVLYCSLEMPLEQLQNRFNCMITGLSALKFRSCGFTQEELEQYKKGLKTLNQWNLHILCDYDLTVEKLKNYAQEQQRTGLDFIILDYLGLMSGYTGKSLYEKTTAISRKLKVLATELNVPIMVLVQLNRCMAERKDKRPILSDIRESGAIEQDADFVLFAYRDFIYNPMETQPEELELIISKNRHGMNNATCKLNFDLKSQRITQKWGGFGA